MDKLAVLFTFLKMTPLEPVVTEWEKDYADKKITVAEGARLTEVASDLAQKYLPGQVAEAILLHDIAAAVERYAVGKEAQKTAATTTTTTTTTTAPAP